jgi:hypothetical protein
MYYLALDYHKGHAIFFTQIKITQEKSRIKPFAFMHTKVCSSTNWKLEFKKKIKNSISCICVQEHVLELAKD